MSTPILFILLSILSVFILIGILYAHRAFQKWHTQHQINKIESELRVRSRRD